MKNKRASIFIYSLILTSIALVLGLVILTNTTLLLNQQNFYKTNQMFLDNISLNNQNTYKYIQKLNSDGSGFIDNIGCPKNFTMSGTTVKEIDVNTSLVLENGEFYCLGTFNGKDIKIYFNPDFTDIEKANFDSSEISVNSGSLSKFFSDSETTYLFIEDKNNYYYSDNIDDNFDSDNYNGNSTGTIDYYTNFEDNDSNARKKIIGIIKPNTKKNIFWNNNEIEDFIENNPNNNNSINQKLGEVSNGNLFLEINTGAILSVIKYDKNIYEQYGEIKVNSEPNSSLMGDISGSGYLKIDGPNISLTSGINQAKDFDFINNGYLLFLENTDSDLLEYELYGVNEYGSGIILNPINDDISNTGSLDILGYDVIEQDGKYIGKITKNKFKK